MPAFMPETDVCLPCQIAATKREIAMRQDKSGWLNMARMCSLHGELRARREANALLQAQARNLAADELARDVERERMRSGMTRAQATIPRVLTFPLGTMRRPLQGQLYKSGLEPYRGKKENAAC